MNNSSIRIESNESSRDELRLSTLREFEVRNVKIISAIDEIQKTAAWSSLKETLLDGLVERIEKSIFEEATKVAPDPLKLNRLTGELTWARRYANLTEFASEKRSELLSLREQLYGRPESRGL